MMDLVLDAGKIIIADLILSGDNALIIGMAAAGLAPELRKKAILYGMVIAALLRIIFAVVATQLLGIPGILFIGGLLLFWVCWRLFQEIRAGVDEQAEHAMEDAENPEVLAVAAIADGNTKMLVFGLGLAIVLMAFAATLIMRLLTKYPWISWVGLIVLIYVAAEMFYRGFFDAATGVGPMLGWIEGYDLRKGH